MKKLILGLALLLVTTSASASVMMIIQYTDSFKLTFERGDDGDFYLKEGVIKRSGTVILNNIGSRDLSQEFHVGYNDYKMSISLANNELVYEQDNSVSVSSLNPTNQKGVFVVKAQDFTGYKKGVGESTYGNADARISHSDLKCTVLKNRILCFGSREAYSQAD
ncbi:hypothetical protein [Bdellovibrio svalbardensis]|uniref:Organic solvent tolerance-like N-terminal domain-containing protein n=1 Tax=Bdellovibrio svalbardensis TaxID=2972972 RepID=A0ABT6DI84_9BACT|nr:hypothetical protein [Bdellovibrio svalbardensis]MDG0816501.1 hypothetical protein [Bdellovibrio svalbardensis]